MWGSGNFAAVAERILEAGELVVDRAGVAPGKDVLDVACGTGNATIPAARAGARVTGLDFAPALLDIAREQAADAMVEIDFVEGDAQELPFGDASFDAVVSTFGHMFAPDQCARRREMKRVLRPGGAIAVACWTPEGAIGRMSATIAELVPPPPGGQPPLLWGTEEHVRELWAKQSSSAMRSYGRTSRSESYARFMLESFGPLLNARELLGRTRRRARRERSRVPAPRRTRPTTGRSASPGRPARVVR